jgi:hypothetical protein
MNRSAGKFIMLRIVTEQGLEFTIRREGRPKKESPA